MPDQVDWRAIEQAGPGQAVGRLYAINASSRGLDLTKSRRASASGARISRRSRTVDTTSFRRRHISASPRLRATHVGLDPEKVMTAYHLSGAVPIKRPVALLANFPVADRRAPIGLAVLTVLLVVGAAMRVRTTCHATRPSWRRRCRPCRTAFSPSAPLRRLLRPIRSLPRCRLRRLRKHFNDQRLAARPGVRPAQRAESGRC